VKGPAWFTADRSHIVPDGDPRSAFLAAGPGDDVPTDVQWAEPLEQPDDIGPDVVKVTAEPTKKPARKRVAKPKP
jgi:hypothetical protein